MMPSRPADEARPVPRSRPASIGVLADRMAAALVHHEPGWRLPRLTALARRYNVSSAEVDAAVGELAARHLVRRLPDGQVYRASPAEYRVPLEGVAGLVSHLDPMGGHLACASVHASRRRPPADIGRSLGLPPGDPVVTIRCLWTVGGEPGALSASYLPERHVAWLAEAPLTDGQEDIPLTILDAPGPLPGGSFPVQLLPALAGTTHPTALQIEMGPPPPSAARGLRLAAGEAAVTVTVTFTDTSTGSPVLLTTTMLRPELFRVVVDMASTDRPASASQALATTWMRAARGGEP